MKPTRSNKRLSDSQQLEIIAKLQKPNPPSKQAIAHAYCVSESAIKNFFATRILKTHTTRRFYFISVLGLRARL